MNSLLIEGRQEGQIEACGRAWTVRYTVRHVAVDGVKWPVVLANINGAVREFEMDEEPSTETSHQDILAYIEWAWNKELEGDDYTDPNAEI